MKIIDEHILSLLEETEAKLTVIYDLLQLDDTKHYHKEYIYCLRSFVRELKQELGGDYFSLRYIQEKTQHLLDCSVNIKHDGHE